MRSRLLEMRDKVIRFEHEMVNAESGEVAAITEPTAAQMERTTRRACPLPEAVRIRGRRMVGDGGSEAETPR